MRRLLPIILALSAVCSAQVANQLITVSANGHYLFNSISGQPAYLTGEDGFLAMVELCSSDVTTYLNDRASRGYNAIWMAPVDNVYSAHPPTNCNGDNPWGGAADFTNFNATYWAFVDSVVSAASARGITVFFNPAFVGVNSGDGYFADFNNASLGSTLAAYGTFLGNRYKGFNNIVWLLGGDADVLNNSTVKTNLGLLATAIASADANHLLTVEACRSCTGATGSQSSYSAYSSSPPSWVKLNWSYDQQANITTASGCPLTYTQSSTILPMEGEMWYELEHSLTGANTRAEGYWATLTGCFLGVLFGNGQIWPFSSPNSGNGTTPNWTTQLASVGSVGEQYLGKLMNSRRHWLMVPDAANAVLTGGISSGLTISVVSCASDGSSCIVYDQSGSTNPPQIAMGHFSGTVHAWWYSPSSAATTDLGTFTNSGTHTFTPSDTNDWVLVLDLNSLGFGPPGITPSWAGILASSRAIDWTTAGLPPFVAYGTGGPPCTGAVANCVETITNPWTPPTRAKSGSTVTCSNSAGDVTTINNALAASSPGSFVLLGATTCSIPSNLTLVSGVTLRGSGPMSTFLNVSGASTQIAYGTCCSGISSGPLSLSSYASGTNSVTITGPTCTTTCTSNGLVVGNVAWVQQCDTGWTGSGTNGSTAPSCTSGSYSDTGTLWVCGIDYGACAQNNTNTDTNHFYERQIVTITNVVNNGGGSYTVTFTPGLYLPNWSSSNNARMFWVPPSTFTQGAGFEDMTVTFTFNSTEQFAPSTAYAGWIKGNRIIGATANPNISIGGNHFLISNNLDFAQNFNNLSTPNQESMIRATGSDNLILNNIIQGTQCVWGNGQNFGDVIAYNFCRDAQTAYYAVESVDHNPFGAYLLQEGNQFGFIDDDDTHGTHDLSTDFRNHISGEDAPYLTINSQARAIGNYQRFVNVIGDAIGGTQSTAYQGTSSSVGNEYVISTTDALAGASLMRWGSCDIINAGCRFLAAEVPNTTNMPAGTYPNATVYQNSTPANNNLPCSFFIPGSAFTTSPCAIKTSGGTGLSWWKVCTNYPTCNSFSTPQYPPIGPDQSGGPYVNGHAYDIPAAVAYANLPIDTALQSSFTITGSSWSGGTETLTVSLASIDNGSANHIMGGFQLSGVNAACVPSGLPTNNEILMTGSSTTTVQYALPNPGVTCTGTLKFPTIRQFDESVFQLDSGLSPANTPTFSPGAGTYTGTQSVTVSSTSAGAVICYNTTGSPATNGTTGCTTGTLYTSPVSVAASETLFAVAGGTGFTDSTVGSAAYTINSPVGAKFTFGIAAKEDYVFGKRQFAGW